MLSESLSLLSFSELKNVLFSQLTLLHVAYIYVLTYVVYKALGRYIYFKPQEHSSKINRTFLALSLFIIALHTLSGLVDLLPFFPQYRWLYAVSGLVLLVAPLSMLMERVIWKYDKSGQRYRREWHYNYLPIPNDYYKTSVSKSKTNGSITESWEEEGVESTRKNIHSDALLNAFALIVFTYVSWGWAYESSASYGWLSFVSFVIIPIPIAGVFLDRAIFSWIEFVQRGK